MVFGPRFRGLIRRPGDLATRLTKEPHCGRAHTSLHDAGNRRHHLRSVTMDPAKIAALKTGSTPSRRTKYTTAWGTTDNTMRPSSQTSSRLALTPPVPPLPTPLHRPRPGIIAIVATDARRCRAGSPTGPHRKYRPDARPLTSSHCERSDCRCQTAYFLRQSRPQRR